MSYQVGRVYIWQNQIGKWSVLNGTECTIVEAGRWQHHSGGCSYGWNTDTANPLGDGFVTAEAGDLRPKYPPSGEKFVMDMFKLPKNISRPIHFNCRCI